VLITIFLLPKSAVYCTVNTRLRGLTFSMYPSHWNFPNACTATFFVTYLKAKKTALQLLVAIILGGKIMFTGSTSVFSAVCIWISVGNDDVVYSIIDTICAAFPMLHRLGKGEEHLHQRDTVTILVGWSRNVATGIIHETLCVRHEMSAKFRRLP
jgi:hypothetical protein